MTQTQVEAVLRRFRRQMLLTRILRVLLILLAAGAFLYVAQLPAPGNKKTMFLLGMGALLGWVVLMIGATRLMHQVQAANVLLNIGRVDDAEIWLVRTINSFSLSLRAKMLACQYLASVFFRRDAHHEVVAVCRELLRHRLARFRQIWLNARLMLADSLLMLDEVRQAYEVMRPVYDRSLSLADRMKLLPIQLRYELAADHSASSVQALPEKLQVAELLDSPRAALVHALLAEACRRQAMPEHQAFLLERARLYWDLAELAPRYPVIAPLVGPSE